MVFQRHVLVAQTTAVKIEEKLTTIKIPWQFKGKLVFRYVISSLKDKSMQLKNVHSYLDPKNEINIQFKQLQDELSYMHLIIKVHFIR